MTAYKAYVATAIAFVASLVASWIADSNPVTSKEVAGWVLTALIASGLTGGATYATSNKPRTDP